jgi:hypothetical protein
MVVAAALGIQEQVVQAVLHQAAEAEVVEMGLLPVQARWEPEAR